MNGGTKLVDLRGVKKKKTDNQKTKKALHCFLVGVDLSFHNLTEPRRKFRLCFLEKLHGGKKLQLFFTNISTICK